MTQPADGPPAAMATAAAWKSPPTSGPTKMLPDSTDLVVDDFTQVRNHS